MPDAPLPDSPLPVSPALQVADRLDDARLPDAAFYRSPAAWQQLVDRVLAPSWHLATDALPAPGQVLPLSLLPGALDEPALLARDEAGDTALLSGACTHRGHLLLDPSPAPLPCRQLRCGYHGRRFDLAGRCVASPGFPADALGDADLPRLGFGLALGHGWGAVQPTEPFDAWWGRTTATLGPLDAGVLEPADSVDHDIAVHWALYVENYLEGLHIPHVHPGLARQVDLAAYGVELLPDGVLQVAPEPDADAPAVVLPDGRRVAAAWLWRFPGTMVNVYPWGISINAVLPRGPAHTTVRYRSRVLRPDLRGQGAGGSLGQVEQEDQHAVTRVMTGLRARRWRPGRYAPAEAGVHHFHRLLARALSGAPPLISPPTPG